MTETDVSRILDDAASGDARAAERLLPLRHWAYARAWLFKELGGNVDAGTRPR